MFVQAVPYDTKTGASLWNSDIEPWNNATMMRHTIKADSSVAAVNYSLFL